MLGIRRGTRVSAGTLPVALLLLVMAVHQLYVGLSATPADGRMVRHGILCACGVGLLLASRWFDEWAARPTGRKAAGRSAAAKADSVERIVAQALAAERRHGRQARESQSPWSPENPRPQRIDFDDGTCPYTRDARHPLGTRENPVVVGMPQASDHLVYSSERQCWILTDGLGNGWIR